MLPVELRRSRLNARWLLVFGVLLGGGIARGEDAAGVVIESVEAGFGGYFKVGSWTPVVVTATAPSRQMVHLEVVAPDADDFLVVHPQASPVPLQPGAPTLVRGTFKSGKTQGEIRVRLVSDERTLLAETVVRPALGGPLHEGLTQATPLWVTLGRPAGFQHWLPDATSPPPSGARLPRPTRVAALADPQRLPEDDRGYRGVDLVWLSEGPLLAQISDRQHEALRRWVEQGGRLVVALGRDVAAFRQTPLAEWFPIKPGDAVPLRQMDQIERFAGHPLPLEPGQSASTAPLTTEAGRILIPGVAGAVLVRSPYGFGVVTALGLDVNTAPLADWKYLSEFLAKILLAGEDEVVQQSEGTQLSRLGVTDLSSQLHYALDQFPRVRRLSTWGVLGCIFVFILVIGPFDYLLVHRWLQRPALTWLTFALQVAAGVVIGNGLADWTNDVGPQGAQIDILDVDAASGTVRGTSWANLYSPAAERVRIAAVPGVAPGAPPAERKAIDWNAIAEPSIGGLYRPGGVRLGDRGYRLAPGEAAIEDLPVPTAATRSVAVDWSGTQPGLVTAELESPGVGRLTGRVSHTFPVPLEDCALAYGNRVYFPWQGRGANRQATLRPDQSWDLSRQTTGGQRELRGWLTRVLVEEIQRRDHVGKEYQSRQTPYNPFERDPLELWRIVTFHRAAGGSAYTILRNDVLHEHDFSEHLRLGRAVLFGRLAAPTVSLTTNGKELSSGHGTIVRLVLPVKQLDLEQVKVLKNPGEGINLPLNNN